MDFIVNAINLAVGLRHTVSRRPKGCFNIDKLVGEGFNINYQNPFRHPILSITSQLLQLAIFDIEQRNVKCYVRCQMLCQMSNVVVCYYVVQFNSLS